ncbi:MAG: PfkB family carbohydrate kinase [Pseudomonadota bacterium]
MTDLPILCAGSALWDIVARTDHAMKPGFDVPGRVGRQMGGVALNVALALARRKIPVELLSMIGRDENGVHLIAQAAAEGVGCAHVSRTAMTDAYLVIEGPGGDVFGAVADCATLESGGDTALAPLTDGRLAAADRPWTGTLVVDGNFAEPVLDALPDRPELALASLALVPASPGKAARMARAMRHPHATIYVNRTEAQILCRRAFDDAAAAARGLADLGASAVVVTDGGAASAALADTLVTARPPQVTARSTTGAGDAFLAVHLEALTKGAAAAEALAAANAAAAAHIARHD